MLQTWLKKERQMSTMPLNDGEYNLASLFKQNIVHSGQISEETFTQNLTAYYADEPFRSFVRSAYDQGGENAPQLLLIAFGGPGAIKELMRSAKAHGIQGSSKGTVRRTRAWQSQLIEAMSMVGHQAMVNYFNENKDDLFNKCGVPVTDRADNWENMLVATGRGSLSWKVGAWEGVGVSGDDGKHAIAISYRIDANVKGRKKGSKSGGEAAETDSIS